MVIFHSYVKLPDDIRSLFYIPRNFLVINHQHVIMLFFIVFLQKKRMVLLLYIFVDTSDTSPCSICIFYSCVGNMNSIPVDGQNSLSYDDIEPIQKSFIYILPHSPPISNPFPLILNTP